ncbi:MAG: type VI secretion system tip protein VgrG [Acidobacteriia bacterium]|nr:type VI secretion system tip protein VgrG [Terriglobia bacterium]
MAFSQAGRPIRVTTGAGGGELLMRRFSGFEGVSIPFEFEVEMVSVNDSVDLKGGLHQPVLLSIQLGDASARPIHGRFRKLVQIDRSPEGLTTYRGEIVPWFWFLTLFSGCRIFQEKTAKDIIEQIFSDRGFTDFEFRLQGSPAIREYCVQYRETDFNFVSRLLEEEGIFYFFEHTDSKHTLVMADSNSKFVPCKVQSKAHYVAGTSGIWEDEDVLFTVQREEAVHVGKVSLSDYDFEKPKLNLQTTVPGEQEGEDYDYPGRYKVRSLGDKYARNRLEERESKYLTINGTGNCRTFASGYRFTLADHYRGDTNKDYALLMVTHTAGDNNYLSGDDQQFTYTNEFVAIPHETPFRPPQKATKPIVQGSQTAVVVGKPGEEIWVDKYGRVKVQFHWDREGSMDDKSSCWIRVSQAWAGKNWGWMTIPRIGQEVIVDFLEGDPDQPIITGRVYNADQEPPYSLPGEQTKSTMKSYSSKGGGGFNEIRLEDKKGKEQIFIHAEKNQDIRVKDSAFETIGAERHLVVSNQFEKVKCDKHLEVAMNQNEKVGGTVSLNAGMNLQQKVGMNYALDAGISVHVKAGINLVIESGVTLTLKVGGNFININPAGIFISGTLVMINSGGAAGAGAGCSPTSPKPAKEADTAEAGKAVDLKAKKPVKPSKYSKAALALSAAAASGAPYTGI